MAQPFSPRTSLIMQSALLLAKSESSFIFLKIYFMYMCLRVSGCSVSMQLPSVTGEKVSGLSELDFQVVVSWQM